MSPKSNLFMKGQNKIKDPKKANMNCIWDHPYKSLRL